MKTTPQSPDIKWSLIIKICIAVITAVIEVLREKEDEDQQEQKGVLRQSLTAGATLWRVPAQ